MPDKFRNKYRIPSARMQNWDYGANGAYFITICTKNMLHFFGKISGGVMVLNEIGLLAEKYWMEIPDHFPFVELGQFVVMPNHVHGIIIINNPDSNPKPIYPDISRFQNQGKNTISSIVGSYKSVVTKFANLLAKDRDKAQPCLNDDFAWQSRFYDIIIRDYVSFVRIQNYIANNPLKWKEDKFNGGTDGET